MHTALTIAGSDSGGGAGIQADLKTFAALGVFGTSVVTAVTAQNTRAVAAVLELPPEMVAAQLDAVLSDIGADAAKTGMLASAALVEVVSAKVAEYRLARLVVDPVMVASSGRRLLSEDAIRGLRERLLPLALVVTPNIPEAEVLVARPIASPEDRRWAARQIAALGARHVVITGGHLPGDEVVDLLYDGHEFAEFRGPRIASRHTHGTGCTFSAAVAAYLACGHGVPGAVQLAKAYVAGAIRHAVPLGHGPGPLNHMWQAPSGLGKD